MSDDVRAENDTELQGPRPDAPRRASGRGRWMAIGIGAGLIILGIWFVATRLPGWLTTPENPAPASTTAPTGDAKKIHATLFYLSEDGTALSAASRQVLYGETPAEQARRLLEAQVATPGGGAHSAIPDGTTVRAVFLTEQHEAYVDLGGAIRTAHSGGSLDEALAVYAIVNVITVNLPDIVAVQILVDGKEVDSIAGHMDLRRPIAKALDWIEKGP
ncbi:MAG: GerMN domain-containing protein [Vicinamibacterales bacterium]